MKELQTYTKEELIERILELELFNAFLISDQKKQLRMDFSWAGNLGKWYLNLQTGTVVFSSLKVERLGFSADDIPRRVHYSFFTQRLHPEDYPAAMQSMQQVYDGVSTVYEVEYRIRKLDGEYIWFYDRGTVAEWTEDGAPLVVAGIVFDVTDRKIKEKEVLRKLEKDVMYDSMTGLKTRSSIMKELERLSADDAYLQDDMSVIFIDIDHFKTINDTYGHLFGDRVIGTVGTSIGQLSRGDDEVGRYGGEEFLMVLPHTSLAESQRIAETVRRNVESLILEDGVRTTISCGVAARRIGEQPMSVLKRADENLYRAKDRGRNCVVSE